MKEYKGCPNIWCIKNRIPQTSIQGYCVDDIEDSCGLLKRYVNDFCPTEEEYNGNEK